MNRMLKKSAAGVLASLSGSTYARQRQGTYPLACDRSERFKRSLVCTSSPASLAAALLVERRVLARLGWAGENHSLFEHPEVIPQPARGLWRQQ